MSFFSRDLYDAITLDSLSSLSKNELAARALRARMSGNMEECQKIEEMLQNMQETVIVTPLDERGRMISELTTKKTMTKDNNSAASQLRQMLREEKQESTRSHDLSFIKTYVSLTFFFFTLTPPNQPETHSTITTQIRQERKDR